MSQLLKAEFAALAQAYKETGNKRFLARMKRILELAK